MGCCDFELPDGTTSSVLVFTCLSICAAESLDDPALCMPCQHAPECDNPCEHCEYCLGKKVLPSDCPVDGDQCCKPAQAKCSPTVACPPEQYCLTGCCIPNPT